MPTYHFHVNGQPDEQGLRLDDVADAKCQALKTAGQILCDHPPDEFWHFTEWTMRVTDSQGLELFQLTVFGTDAATNGRPLAQSGAHDRVTNGRRSPLG